MAENGDTEIKPEEQKKEAEEKNDDTKDEAKTEKKEALKPKEPEKPKEVEEDAADDTRPKVSPGAVAINPSDSTLNVLPSHGGKMLLTLSEGGFQHLFAGARSTCGIKAGRYLMEVRVVECHKGLEPQQNQGRMPMQRHMCRIGLSHGGSSVFLDEQCVMFDSEGNFQGDKARRKVAMKWERGWTMGLLINLEAGSPAANTVSLFRDGVRVSEPQPIPESMLGKPLFPTLTYKSVSLQVNFGPVALAPLPFKCHMLSEAAAADVEIVPVPEPKGGKSEVVFPIGLPENGYFDWVKSFTQKNPDFTELSDRTIFEWAAKSGMVRPKGSGNTNDKLDVKYGIPSMDDMSIRTILKQLAPMTKRNFVVPEMRVNLIAADRKKALHAFPASDFKRTAAVVVGEPTAEYKDFVQTLILGDKKAKAEAEQRRDAAEEARKRLMEEKKKKAEEARKARLVAQGKEVEETKEDDTMDEIKETAEVVVELTDEEKALKFRKSGSPDISDILLSKCYSDFSLPSTEEGFDEISYKWQGEDEASKILKDWIFAKKLTQRVDTIQPGTWFKEEWTKWTKTLQEWRKLQTDIKNPTKKAAVLAARLEAKKKEAEEKGDETYVPAEPMEVDFEELDVFAVADVVDVGSGDPLFLHFSYEDWVLLSTRVELHLLLHSFKKDLDDPDRPSFTEKDLAFYYNKYFKKTWNLNSFGVKTLSAIVNHVKDTITIADKSFLNAILEDSTDFAQFVKLSENHRRERQRRADAGDETAELKFPRNAAPMGTAGLKPAGGPQQPSTRPALSVGIRPGFGPNRVAGVSPSLTPTVGVKRALTPAGGVAGASAPATGLSSSFVAKQPRLSPFGRGLMK